MRRTENRNSPEDVSAYRGGVRGGPVVSAPESNPSKCFFGVTGADPEKQGVFVNAAIVSFSTTESRTLEKNEGRLENVEFQETHPVTWSLCGSYDLCN